MRAAMAEGDRSRYLYGVGCNSGFGGWEGTSKKLQKAGRGKLIGRLFRVRAHRRRPSTSARGD